MRVNGNLPRGETHYVATATFLWGKLDGDDGNANDDESTTTTMMITSSHDVRGMMNTRQSLIDVNEYPVGVDGMYVGVGYRVSFDSDTCGGAVIDGFFDLWYEDGSCGFLDGTGSPTSAITTFVDDDDEEEDEVAVMMEEVVTVAAEDAEVRVFRSSLDSAPEAEVIRLLFPLLLTPFLIRRSSRAITIEQKEDPYHRSDNIGIASLDDGDDPNRFSDGITHLSSVR
jgi:hypothetical protein